MTRREGKIRAHIAFDSKRKFSMIAVEHKNLCKGSNLTSFTAAPKCDLKLDR